MRCPKCHYISFGSVDRCRNCGYEFSFAPEATPIDLPIQTPNEPVGPYGDLQLDATKGRGEPSRPSGRAPDSGAASERHTPATPAAPARLDLPLFVDRDPLNDAPLISVPSAPRQPLSVRRGQPGLPKPRVDTSGSPLALDPPRSEPASARTPAERTSPPVVVRNVQKDAAPEEALDDTAGAERVVAPVTNRLLAGLIDVLILATIDGGVLASTLRVVGLTFADVLQLPAIPLALFLLLLNGGYLTIFTAAGGQTIGKMIAGIKVIAERPQEESELYEFTTRVSLGSAVLRSVAYLVSLLPVGLGFAAILLDRDGRALHDRLAETRVVKA